MLFFHKENNCQISCRQKEKIGKRFFKMCGPLVSSSETVVLTHLNTWEEKVVSTWWASSSWGKCSAEDRPAKHCSGRRDMLSSLGSSKQLKSWIIRERQVSFLSVQPLKQMSKGKEEKKKITQSGRGAAAAQKGRTGYSPFLLSPLLSQSFIFKWWAVQTLASSLTASLPVW